MVCFDSMHRQRVAASADCALRGARRKMGFGERWLSMRRWTAWAAVVLGLAMLHGARALPAPAAAGSHATAPSDARVDINHASIDELMKVPGMTRTWAARIVRFRPYRTKADLVDHGVVTSEVYGRIKDFIVAHRQKE